MNNLWSGLLQPLREPIYTDATCRPGRPPGSAKYVAGDQVARWTLLEYRPSEGTELAKWLCRCTCGAERWVTAGNLASGKSKGCGHYRTSPPPRDLALRPGDQVGEWTLLEYRPGAGRPVRRAPKWHAVCSCGKHRWVLAHNLMSGESKSCGHTRIKDAGLPAGNPVT